MRKKAALAMGLMLASVGAVRGDEPRPVPLTRPEMKQYLEDMKARKPRIPLPELTEDEKAKLGERGSEYESRLRTLYLPPGEGFGFGGGGGGGGPAGAGAGGGGGGGAARGPPRPGDPAAKHPAKPTAGTALGRNTVQDLSPDQTFNTELFWTGSRTNNFQYCLGHQES